MPVHALESVLAQVLSTPGVLGAAVVDAVTGLTYAEAGDCGPAGSGTEVRDLAELVSDRLHEAGAWGELENVVVTGRRIQHIVQVLPRRGDAVLLSAVLDRADTNLALASRQLSEHARGLVV
ncbi:hypothetical protein [Actinacidiphila sp. ITFR-21]|uniref:hypothetical protein n=1 Tax=Actinacidiphila sp. ITFR-21 TaxID=3075199 RepID=UPI00288A7EDB|nr:hypothetical protein [Streptomyces sp. ITFR-21]WNI14387.1 hypothetical protein RLT57_01760 [Streptomyces sp. ITFR-21]